MTYLTLENSKIAVIGLGYVGLPLAVEFGKKRAVIGFDISQRRIDALQSGKDKTLEVSDEELVKAQGLSFTNQLDDLKKCDVYIVTVPTPINQKNEPDLSMLKKACETIGKLLIKNDTVIFESTVYPGATEEFCKPILEKESSLKVGEFGLGFSPERINPGDKINTFKNINKIISGNNSASLKKIYLIYKKIFPNI